MRLKIAGIGKWILAAAAAVVILVQSFSGRGSSTDLQTMTDKVYSAAVLENVQEADNQMIRRLYGLDANDFSGVVLYYPTTNMGAEELLIVKMSDRSQAEAVRAAIERRLQTQKDSFEGYGVEQFEMLENSVTVVRGNYALFCSSKDPRAAEAAFDAAY